MTEVTVIGGGIIGVCCALELQRHGVSTTLIERGQIGGEASFGNCALLAVSEIVPLAKPGILKKLPGWIINPNGPLAVRPSHLAVAMPWLLRFLANGRKDKVQSICHGLGAITSHAQDDFDEIIEISEIKDIWAENELLYLYDTYEEYKNDQFSWDLRSEEGYKVTELDRQSLKNLENDLNADSKFGLIAHGWKSFTDPLRLTSELATYFVNIGGEIINDEVKSIHIEHNKPTSLNLATKGRLKVDNIVIAAGCWSQTLLKQIGVNIPLAPLHGYHTDLFDSNVKLTRPVLYASGGFVNTPVDHGLRIAGTVEIAPINAKPNFNRASILVKKAKKQLFPSLNYSKSSQWIGARPFMPDTLPVIGPAANLDKVWLAVGHGQLGLTMGPTTGKIISSLILKKNISIDISNYRVDRKFY